VAFLRDIPFVMIAKLFRKKVVAHLRGGNFRNWYDSCGKMMKWLVKKIQKKIDAQIVLGENLRSMFKELMPDEKIFVVPNGGDFKIPLIKKNNNNPTKVLFLSNFIRTKGILDLLYAIPIVFKKIQNVEFIFAGAWTDVTVKEEFTNFVNENKMLPKKVIGPVFGSLKYELLGTVDIFVLPTYYPNEGHPWVIVEAMAAGLPIISTNQGAITESVIDGVNGFIVEKQNKEQIAEKIIHLITNPPLRKKMECENRRLYLENFTESKMVIRFYEIFINII
jgi:glycosyltransferase involved in cell wall biosynthesis